MSKSLLSRFQNVLSGSPVAGRAEFDEPQNKGFVISMCVLTSFVLWFAFSMQETYTQVLEFETEVLNLPPDQALSQLPPKTIQVQIEGEGIQILRLYYRAPILQIDALAEEIDLAMRAPEFITNVSILAVTPRMVDIGLEQRVVKRVPIRSRVSMEFASTFRRIGDIKLSPDSILISGAHSIIDGIDYWPTAQRSLGEMRDSLDVVIALSDSLSRLITLEFSEVRIEANIQAFTEAERIVEVRTMDLPPDVHVNYSPTTVRVVYQIPISQFDVSIETDDFYVFVPYEDIVLDNLGVVYPILHVPDFLEIQNPVFSPESHQYFEL